MGKKFKEDNHSFLEKFSVRKSERKARNEAAHAKNEAYITRGIAAGWFPAPTTVTQRRKILAARSLSENLQMKP